MTLGTSTFRMLSRTSSSSSTELVGQNGALDAAAYAVMSYVVLQVLWKAATILKTDEFDWWTVREKALMALSSYEVYDLNRSLGEGFSFKNTIINFADLGIEGRRVRSTWTRNEENYLLPFHNCFLHQSPAAFLLLKCYKEGILPNTQSRGKSRVQAWEVNFEEQFTEMANSMNLQGNLILALLNLDPCLRPLASQTLATSSRKCPKRYIPSDPPYASPYKT
ncbi:hypothetical protein GOP47_0017543 [Adiantum capillus-veneris]|uniref:Uncharacterized protein n=1 Tax=Adiantum capillus-veneris TaxID=13818 RepID=A0A9D4ZAW3_ADICA|nr:hypothetical protein GOP47_0017543 [Adiantum capillus-veneris]